MPVANPIVLVAKKDGTTRFCMNYYKLITVIEVNVYSLLRIDDSLDLLSGQ